MVNKQFLHAITQWLAIPEDASSHPADVHQDAGFGLVVGQSIQPIGQDLTEP